MGFVSYVVPSSCDNLVLAFNDEVCTSDASKYPFEANSPMSPGSCGPLGPGSCDPMGPDSYGPMSL